MQQRTIKKPIEVVGIGLHKGEPIKLRLEPLDVDAGIIFYREDLALTIPLSPASVIDTRMATVIGSDKGFISTIEHFLSAVYAYGIDNMRVIVNGNEMPVMDGSSISFCLLLDEAGVEEQGIAKKIIRVKQSVEVSDGEKFVRLLPSEMQNLTLVLILITLLLVSKKNTLTFQLRILLKRSHVREHLDLRGIFSICKAKGLALGATLQNAIGLDDHKVLNPEGLRFDNEFARHKILDAMGDMMVSGHNILGRYESFAGSHHLNYKLTTKLLSDSKNYDLVAVEELQSRTFARSFA